MKRRSLLAFLLLGITFLATPASLLAQAKTAHKVLFAVTSGDEADWKLALGNLRNLLTGIPDAEVEVVAFGPGITMLAKPSSVNDDIQALMKKNVKFNACENSMRGRNLKMADLVDNAGSVPSGIVEVVKKQEEGYSYIKAGR